MKQRQEFKVGDTVRFRAYSDQPSEGLEATIKSVSIGNCGDGKDQFGHEDLRVFYEISGEVLSNTTGKCLIGSEYYVDPSKDYTGHQFRDTDGNMWTCLTEWHGCLDRWITAKDGEFRRDFEACDIFRFEQ